MKKNIYKAALFLLIALTVLSFSGCGESSKVKAVISDFQTACNNMDLNAVVACMDNPIFNTLNGVSDLIGLDKNKLVDLLGQFLGDFAASDYLKTMKIKVSKVTVDNSIAFATAEISGKNADGTDYSKNVVFECELVDDAWKIKNIKDAA
ncbi:MAG: hypothetical protein K6G90_10070 [Clostridia bacterium]|nr:hypothetical protein [Clostridia bacterium]